MLLVGGVAGELICRDWTKVEVVVPITVPKTRGRRGFRGDRISKERKLSHLMKKFHL